MVVAAFWDVSELKMDVSICLSNDRCDSDLARCAHVNQTWADPALNALWLGCPEMDRRYNETRAKAILSSSSFLFLSSQRA